MSTNRPFLANFLAAFRAQSTYKAAAAGSQSAGGPSQSISPSQISQGARAIATKASTAASAPAASDTTATTASTHHYHHHHQPSRPHSHPRSPLSPPSTVADSPIPSASPTPAAAPPSSPPTPASSNPIPIAGPDRQRRGSDSSSGSGGFRDALGPEKWYVGGRTPAGEERFYRLGMVTKGGGRLGGSGRVGSIDQLSL
ncbi:hypothetical protein ATEIFO6365_0001072700 [Aspergillus terreus]|uniref:Uncharacterized protein n=1 Tax=Aspergillus terreus TaxID=33178 RepID=A0A5M3YM73_ASPTE|nr:hypothetical protein ATETN484_0001064800 [Aspergillus terreus]GFF12504.1 hypothetical protein ATEIFO6365_0001072700 [Aspergillus terreus]